MSTSASASDAYTVPLPTPLTTWLRNSVRSIVRSHPQVGATNLVVALELRGGSLRGDAAGLEDVAALRDLERQVRVLLDDQHGDRQITVQLTELLEQTLRDERRQPHRRLIEQQQLRARHQRARDGKHLL